MISSVSKNNWTIAYVYSIYLNQSVLIVIEISHRIRFTSYIHIHSCYPSFSYVFTQDFSHYLFNIEWKNVSFDSKANGNCRVWSHPILQLNCHLCIYRNLHWLTVWNLRCFKLQFFFSVVVIFSDKSMSNWVQKKLFVVIFFLCQLLGIEEVRHYAFRLSGWLRLWVFLIVGLIGEFYRVERLLRFEWKFNWVFGVITWLDGVYVVAKKLKNAKKIKFLETFWKNLT